MSRYVGPKLRIVRRLGTLPALTNRVSKRTKTPGQHGTEISRSQRDGFSNYGRRLKEKQKLRFNYGLSESKLVSYVNLAKKRRGSAGLLLLQMLELRLDTIVYNMGVGPTIQASRQIVNHGHVLVNNQKVNVPSFQCSIGDKIRLKPDSPWVKSELHPTNTSSHLETITENGKTGITGVIKQVPNRKDLELDINELFVIEYYSR